MTTSRYLIFKRAIDVLGSLTLVVVLSPVLLSIAIAVLASSGRPILFRQRRLGRDGRTFEMLKFRTMRVGAPDLRNPDGTTFNSTSDDRVTPIGRFLRRTSLDELPQLLNVIRGDMSLIGGRPDLPEAFDWYTEAQRRRLELRPGITGWAQVNGRNDLPLPDRWAHDLWYVDNVSFLLDLRILLLTLGVVLTGAGITRGRATVTSNSE